MISTVVLHNIVYCLLILVLILLTYLGIEGIRVLRGARRLMDRYIDHPEHKKFVSQLLKPVLNKVLIYDFIN